MCAFEENPAVLFPSSTDETNRDLGFICSKLETPLPGSAARTWSLFWKLLRELNGLPL